MIFGSFGNPTKSGEDPLAHAEKWGVDDEKALRHSHINGSFALGMLSSGAPSHDAGHFVYSNKRSGVTIAVYGNIFNFDELADEFSASTNGRTNPKPGPILLAAYRKLGIDLFARLNGNFVIVVHDERCNRLWIARDHLGIESLYFYRRNETLYFSSNLQLLAGHSEVETGLNPVAVLRYLLFNYNPAFDTVYSGIQKLRPGYVLRIENEKMIISAYWYLSFRDPFTKSVADYREELPELLREAIRIRLQADRFRTGAYLSGGMDSSTVVGLMRPMVEGAIRTFSFRCRGKGFDESEYARIMSRHCETEHYEVPYEPDDVARIIKIAETAQEPFSDIGIEVGSFLLAEKASGLVDYVLTGDGGDELFAGHPVYLADRMAEKFQKIPGLIRNPLTGLLQKLPDTDQKKSLVVKAKRFSYSAQFPANLYSNRWRIYYTEKELQRLLHPDWRDQMTRHDPLEEIRALYTEADGRDNMSKTLYGDYFTVVGFYLRRMELIRAFGLEGRFPMLDYRLVEYAARIPSNMKIGKDGSTKWIFHQVMQGLLPDEIVFRKDKLGHSVPFKNWLRDAPVVNSLLGEHLTEETIRRRGIFDYRFIQELQKRHASRRENNSHRLWALLVFELWCRKNLDRKPELDAATREAA